eukprot:6422962-Pyramimonas_sp.AAC.1
MLKSSPPTAMLEAIVAARSGAWSGEGGGGAGGLVSTSGATEPTVAQSPRWGNQWKPLLPKGTTTPRRGAD